MERAMASLPTILRLNALSCLGFGALFLAAPGPVAAALGAAPPLAPALIGAGLLANGGHLLLAARRRPLRRAEVLWFSAGDMLWWLGSLGLVATRTWVTSPAGVAATLAVAAVVAGLGTAQLWSLGAARTGTTAAGLARRLARSWRALPLAVRLWLGLLNLVFLAAPLALPWDEARVVLLAYVAAAPPLLGLAALDGGMSRRLGLAHLPAWAPLLLWLVAAGPAAGGAYPAALAAATAVCLGFDVVDALRWRRGERAIPGL